MNMDIRNLSKYWYMPFLIIGYYVWFQLFYNMVAYKTIYPYSSKLQLVISIVCNFLPIVMTFAIDWYIVNRLNQKRTRAIKFIMDILLSFVGVVLTNMTFMFCYYLIIGIPAVDWAGTVFNNGMILMIIESVFLVRAARRANDEAELARHNALALQYDVLKAQVNPHFLFNSLNILYSLTFIDIKRSQDFIQHLSKVYRYILAKRDCQLVDIHDELRFLESYINVLKIRYNDALKVKIDIEDKKILIGKSVVSYCTQLCFENITKHNEISEECPMLVIIKITNEGIAISNPIKKKINTGEKSGIGLDYIKRLYEHLGKKFEIYRDDNNYITLIPFVYR